MSEHRSIMEKLTRLRDQLPTTQLAMEQAQELLDDLNEHWFGKYLDEQQDLLQLIVDYANGQQLDEVLLHEVTRVLTAKEQQLETGRFWAEIGNWQSAARAMNCTEIEAMTKLPDLASDLKLQIESLNAKAMDLCQRIKPKPVQKEEELPPEAQRLPKKYQKDKRRYKTGWGV